MSQSRNFDQFATSYQAEMSDALGRLGGESSYYLAQKVHLLRRELKKVKCSRILDFGCGIGLAIPFLHEAFSPDLLVCSDESEESLIIIRKTHPNVRALNIEQVGTEEFDLIFVANVLHHIEPSARQHVIKDLCKRLRPGGVIGVFEHNPLNLVTQRIVSNCSFDDGVELLRKSEVMSYFAGSNEMSVVKSGYCLFTPEPLKKLNWIDRHLKWAPFGGQHFVLARRC
jgi:SAM-dependent methyltransferase